MLENVISKIKAIKVLNLPIGDAVLLLAGLGINDILIPTTSALTRLPPIATGPGLAVLIQLPAVKKILGSTLATVLSATAITLALDQQFNVRGRTSAIVAGLVSRVTPTAGAAAPGAAAPSAALGQIAPEALMTEQERRVMATLKVR